MPDRARSKVGATARETVISYLRKTANELEYNGGELVEAVALVVAGKDGAFLGLGPLGVLHTTLGHGKPLPDDLISGLERILDDARNFSDRLKEGADA